ncbi:MAG: M14 family metallopeptidase [Roseburia sp.]
MIECVARVELPVDEVLEIKKHRYMPESAEKNNYKRLSIVTGIHGDELEGQYICYEVGRRIKEHPELLSGIVDIYPALNPFGIDTVNRGIPAFDLDMNRIFPGRRDGDMYEYVAAEIIKDLEGSDLCIDIHASNIYLTEIPQIRINELHRDKLLPYAKLANVDFIWVHGASTVLEATLAHSLNSRNTPTLVEEIGVGMRVTKEYGQQIVTGIFRLMKELGIWAGETEAVREPVISERPEEVSFLNAPMTGIFIKEMEHGTKVKKGDQIGSIIDPLKGELLCKVTAPVSGWLFTIREYPVVDEGSLMGRILTEDGGMKSA